MKRLIGISAVVISVAGCATMTPSGPAAVASLKPTSGRYERRRHFHAEG